MSRSVGTMSTASGSPMSTSSARSVTACNMNVDRAMEELGSWGRFQIINYCLICMPIIFTSMFGLCYVFTAGFVPHRCFVPECDVNGKPLYLEEWLSNAVPLLKDGSTPSKCLRFPAAQYTADNISCSVADLFLNNITIPCSQWVYDDSESTIASEFGIACDSEWKRTMVGTVNSIGQFIGLPIAGIVSDKIGRKMILVTSLVLASFAGFARSMSWNYETFLFMAFLEPVVSSGIYTASFVLGVELVSPNKRVLAGALVSMFYAVGETLLAAVAMLVRHWRSILMIIYCPSFLFVAYYWMIPESVRWLASQGREDEAFEVLLKAAKTNGVVLSEGVARKPELNSLVTEEKPSIEKHESCKRSEGVFLQVLTSRILLLRFLNCCFCWLANTFVFYGLTLNSVAVGGDKYTSFMMTALIEVPGYIASIFVMKSFGRRLGLASSLVSSGAFVLASCFIPPDLHIIQTTLFMVSKLSITVSFTVLYVYTAEMFPTPLRHSIISTSCMVGRFGSMMAPQTPLLAQYMESLPLLLLGSVAISAGALALLFPETLGSHLPDTIAEAELVGSHKRGKNLASHVEAD